MTRVLAFPACRAARHPAVTSTKSVPDAHGTLVPRDDLKVIEGDAAPGSRCLVIKIKQSGSRLCRAEVPESQFTAEFINMLIRWAEMETDPPVRLLSTDPKGAAT